MVAMNETNGFDVANGRATLCVHFSASGAEHCISFVDAAPGHVDSLPLELAAASAKTATFLVRESHYN